MHPVTGQSPVPDIEDRIKQAHPVVARIREQVARVVVGQTHMVNRLLIGLLADGHVLLEGVPGLAKTTAVHTLARAMSLSFKRIQFTPDLLPSDLVGTQIYNPREGSFTARKGPVFAHIVLADEINRAPAKVQSALLEAMQERQVTFGGHTHALPRPFLVLATQNPIEQEGTYPLPEAQADRFMMKVRIDYPSAVEEREILARAAAPAQTVESVASLEDVMACQEVVSGIIMEDVVADYIVSVVRATRDPEAVGLGDLARAVEFGASPRATLALAATARAYAFLVEHRHFVTPDDVKAVGNDVMRHRVLLSYEAEAEGMTTDDVITKVFEQVEIP